MRIQHNISALNTYRQMATNNTGTSKALEKLSSGYKINRAGDDAAGLAISEKMRAQINGLNRASSNAQDGVSLIQAAEGALQETHSILQRMRELGVQAANDTNELEDRQAIADEINQLKTEVDRIAYTTEFNKKTILDGSLKDGQYATKILAGNKVSTGAHVDQAVANDLVINNQTAVAGIYTVEIADGDEGAYETKTFSFDLTAMEAGDTMTMGIDFDNSSRTGGQTNLAATVNVFTYTVTGDASVDNAAFINGFKDALKQVVTDYDITSSGNNITFTAKGIGTGYTQMNLTATEVNYGTGSAIDDGSTNIIQIQGADATITVTDDKGNQNQISTDPSATGEYVGGVFTEATTGLVFEISDLTKTGSSILQINSGSALTLQVGANPSSDQTVAIDIQSLSAAGLGINNLDVTDNESARATVASIESAIQTVSTQRAALGAVQNRLEHTSANLDTVAENLQGAESRIRDVDMAKEMMNFTKFNILVQASQAMMAQANSQPQGVLQLLR